MPFSKHQQRCPDGHRAFATFRGALYCPECVTESDADGGEGR